MKKFTLLFSLLVAMVTTVFATPVAVNDEAETVEFGIKKLHNNPAEFISAVLIEFTKDVTVTLPEEGVSVLNEQGESVAKITSFIQFAPYVINFQFEKTEVEDKDGKTELQETYITTPGTYTLTFPAGAVKSVDGEDFTETLTLTVAIPFRVNKIHSPQDPAERIDAVLLEFSKNVTVTLPEGGVSILNEEGETAIKIVNFMQYAPNVINFQFETTTVEVEGKDGKTETQEVPGYIDEPGTYTLTFPAGTITSVDGEDFTETLTFTVVKLEPVVTITPDEGASLTEIKDIVITIQNAEVTCDETKEVTAYLSGTPIAGTASYEDNVITVSFGETLTAEGEYSISIPAALYTVNGTPNDAKVLKYSVTQVTPLEYIVMPAAGEVGQIETITITFNQTVGLGWDDNSQTPGQIIDLVDSKGNKTELQCLSVSGATLTYAKADWNGTDYVPSTITEPETYTLDLSQILLNYGAVKIEDYGTWWYEYKASMYLSGTYTWTVTGDTAIDEVKGENGEQVIYDLTGRRVKEITNAGIYIVNGNKVLIK